MPSRIKRFALSIAWADAFDSSVAFGFGRLVFVPEDSALLFFNSS